MIIGIDTVFVAFSLELNTVVAPPYGLAAVFYRLAVPENCWM